jgi:UDP-2,3-diacylglucosamine hydrolase
VSQYFSRYGVDLMIHGHTHRPAIHSIDIAGHPARRVVLGDWYEQGSVLRVDGDRLELDALAG